MSRLWEDFLEDGKVEGCPIIDIHCHMGPFYGSHMPYSDPETMIRRMERTGIRLIVFCHHYALFVPEIGNSINIEIARRYPDRSKAYCGINPNYQDKIRTDLETFDRFRDVYVGFKLLPDYHKVPLSDKRYEAVFEFANEHNLIVLTHTWGGSIYDGLEEVEKVLKRYKNILLLLGHSLHGDWDGAIRISKNYENAYLELCAVLDERGIIERFVRETDTDRIVFGTDFPWFNHHYYIGALLGSGISDSICEKILYINAKRVLKI